MHKKHKVPSAVPRSQQEFSKWWLPLYSSSFCLVLPNLLG